MSELDCLLADGSADRTLAPDEAFHLADTADLKSLMRAAAQRRDARTARRCPIRARCSSR